jgi:HK97 gp10 family phage protein
MAEFFKIEGLAAVVQTLQQLPPEIVSKNGGPVRFALRKAAVILQKEAQQNIQKIMDTPNKDGTIGPQTGILKKSIIVKRKKPPPGLNGEVMIVAIKQRVIYPGQEGAKEKTTATKVGRLLEQGSEKMTAKPWLRPAFDTKKNEAVQVFVDSLNARVDAVVKKLAMQNGAKL